MGGTERMASFMVGFTVPVFAAQRQLRMRDEASAMERMADADLSAMRVEVGARIAELVAQLEQARALVGLFRRDVVPQARAGVASALASYRTGGVDFMTLVDARMTVTAYERELHGLVARYGRTLAELEMTIGRELPPAAALLVEER
jgi:outer membrane protein TolC